MKIGIIAEGVTDCAVLRNILKAYSIDGSDIKELLPDSLVDETDRQLLYGGFSNWTLVKKYLREDFSNIDDFFSFHDDAILIVQIDTAECTDVNYDVVRPNSQDQDYLEILYSRVQEKLKSWLPEEFHSRTFFAAAVEETEAWIIALLSDENSDSRPDPKSRMMQNLGRWLSSADKRKFDTKSNPRAQYDILSVGFKKKRTWNSAPTKNYSLLKLTEQLDTHLLDQQYPSAPSNFAAKN